MTTRCDNCKMAKTAQMLIFKCRFSLSFLSMLKPPSSKLVRLKLVHVYSKVPKIMLMTGQSVRTFLAQIYWVTVVQRWCVKLKCVIAKTLRFLFRNSSLIDSGTTISWFFINLVPAPTLWVCIEKKFSEWFLLVVWHGLDVTSRLWQKGKENLNWSSLWSKIAQYKCSYYYY